MKKQKKAKPKRSAWGRSDKIAASALAISLLALLSPFILRFCEKQELKPKIEVSATYTKRLSERYDKNLIQDLLESLNFTGTPDAPSFYSEKRDLEISLQRLVWRDDYLQFYIQLQNKKSRPISIAKISIRGTVEYPHMMDTTPHFLGSRMADGSGNINPAIYLQPDEAKNIHAVIVISLYPKKDDVPDLVKRSSEIFGQMADDPNIANNDISADIILVNKDGHYLQTSRITPITAQQALSTQVINTEKIYAIHKSVFNDTKMLGEFKHIQFEITDNQGNTYQSDEVAQNIISFR